MKLGTEIHLRNITVDNILEYQKEVFALYASAKGVKIGFNGFSQFVVKTKSENYIFNDPAQAVDKYTKLVKQKEEL